MEDIKSPVGGTVKLITVLVSSSSNEQHEKKIQIKYNHLINGRFSERTDKTQKIDHLS